MTSNAADKRKTNDDDPMKQTMLIMEHKIRNLEKRKVCICLLSIQIMIVVEYFGHSLSAQIKAGDNGLEKKIIYCIFVPFTYLQSCGMSINQISITALFNF